MGIETSHSPDEAAVRLVERIASENFELVNAFIGRLLLAIGGPLDQPVQIKVRSVLGLAAGLRLLLWEQRGFFFHRDIGIPQAEEVIKVMFGFADSPSINPDELCRLMLRLCIEKFAWQAHDQLGCDVAVDDLDDDRVLDAIAEILWSMRHTLNDQPGDCNVH